MQAHHVTTPVHGRFLHVERGAERLLVGFHGYAETAEIHLLALEKIAAIGEWSVAAVQALHPFYTCAGDVVASWMTKQDRELAIDDNLRYVRDVLDSLPSSQTLVFLGFSQGAAMAARAAANHRCDGLILLGGDIPPEIDPAQLPPVLLGRGLRDEWYSAEKFKKDLSFLRDVTPCEFDGGHEWSDAFREATSSFLGRIDHKR